MARTVIAVRHVHFEDLGLLDPLLRSRGADIRYLDAGVDPLPDDALASADLVVMLGAPVGVYETDAYPFLHDEKRALAARLRDERPTLGICLGAQLIADALGAPVTKTGAHEIGYAPVTLTPAGADSVLAPLDGVPVLHWHGDRFDTPAAGRALARTEGCPDQAFAVGAHVLALQFHLEADHTRIERWLIGHAAELAAAGVDPREIRRDAASTGARLARAATAVFDAWLDGVLPR